MDIVIDVFLSINVFVRQFALLLVCEMDCLREIRQSLSTCEIKLTNNLFEK